MLDRAYRLDRQLCFALHATSRAVIQAYAPLLAPLGVTYPQYLVLLALWETDGQTVSGIGQHLFLDSGTLTPLLKRLEGQGLVVRRRDADDERVVRVSLTATGKKHRSKAEAVSTGVACSIGIAPTEIHTLRDSLHRILRRLQSAHEKPAPASKRSPTHRPKKASR